MLVPTCCPFLPLYPLTTNYHHHPQDPHPLPHNYPPWWIPTSVVELILFAFSGILRVVDGEQQSRVRQPLAMVPLPEQHGDGCCLPLVTMDDVRLTHCDLKAATGW